MKKIIQLFSALLFVVILSTACDDDTVPVGCIDKDQIDTDAGCTTLWDPVCGCDGQTYSNDCFAFISGVTSWTGGECPN